VIGFDADHGALERCFLRAQAEQIQLLPLYLDAANPSPSQGWSEVERPGIAERASADAVIALAFVHHIAIGKNVPLDRVIAWLVDLAPQGIVEFVPKADPMVRKMLAIREDIFADYTEEAFVGALERRASIVKARTISESGRKAFWFNRL
jgi:ribosomal protein L11 methylase PrmA